MYVKGNPDCSFNLYGLPVQNVWPIAPLLGRLDRCGSQQRVPADNLQALNASVFTDNCRQYHNTLNAGVPCHRWVGGLNPIDQQTLDDALGNAHALRTGWLVWVTWGRQRSHWS